MLLMNPEVLLLYNSKTRLRSVLLLFRHTIHTTSLLVKVDSVWSPRARIVVRLEAKMSASGLFNALFRYNLR